MIAPFARVAWLPKKPAVVVLLSGLAFASGCVSLQDRLTKHLTPVQSARQAGEDGKPDDVSKYATSSHNRAVAQEKFNEMVGEDPTGLMK